MGTCIQQDGQGERKRARITHRIGVTIFALILLAALAGLLGKGPLSKVRAATSDGGLSIDYFRFIHYQGPTDLKIHVKAEGATNGFIHLQVSNEFVNQTEIERIEPEPESTLAGEKFFTYHIRVETNAPVQVRIRFLAGHFGSLSYDLGLAGGPSARLRHFAFP
jgi:hypothetical protein